MRSKMQSLNQPASIVPNTQTHTKLHTSTTNVPHTQTRNVYAHYNEQTITRDDLTHSDNNDNKTNTVHAHINTKHCTTHPQTNLTQRKKIPHAQC